MRPIPPEHRLLIASDFYFKRSCLSKMPPTSNDRIVIHHAWIYAGKQINEPWNYCPLLESEHSAQSKYPSAHNSKVVNDKIKLIAIGRADLDDLKKRYPKKDWDGEIRRIKINR